MPVAKSGWRRLTARSGRRETRCGLVSTGLVRSALSRRDQTTDYARRGFNSGLTGRGFNSRRLHKAPSGLDGAFFCWLTREGNVAQGFGLRPLAGSSWRSPG